MKLLLLSDATMCADGGGISQTLYNVFSYIKPENILCISDHKSFKTLPPEKDYIKSYITYKFEVISFPNNRFSKYILPFIEWFNYSFNNCVRRFKKISVRIKSFNPDVIISCSNSPVNILIHKKLLKDLDKPVIPYFMDDWMRNNSLKWIGGNLQQTISDILLSNKAWLSISHGLTGILKEKYHASPSKTFIVHNPVDIPQNSVPPQIEKDVYNLVYAGALWDMHFDALLTVAESIYRLKKKRALNLIIYTPEKFWEWRKKYFTEFEVIYGGEIPYHDINEKLQSADALILCSSFSEKWFTHSKGSLQTKVTDYLKARRLVISCGPSYSANHDFFKKYDCGCCIETNKVEEVSMEIDNILNNLLQYQYMVENGWIALQNFSKETVHKKLDCFLNETVFELSN